MPQRNKVCRVNALSKESLKVKLAVAWGRVCGVMGGPGSFAEKAEIDGAAVGRVLAYKSLPEAHTIFNSLRADPTALDEILAHYGVKATPITAQAANDLHTAAGLLDGATEIVKAYEDGNRNHGETLRIADKLRPHLAAAIAIVREADELRGAA